MFIQSFTVWTDDNFAIRGKHHSTLRLEVEVEEGKKKIKKLEVSNDSLTFKSLFNKIDTCQLPLLSQQEFNV